MVKTSETTVPSKPYMRWTPEEHQRLVNALQIHGLGGWKLIAILVGTKTHVQCRTHYQKFEKELRDLLPKYND